MSVPRRFNRPQGLANIDVLIEDDAPISLYFNVVEVPEVISLPLNILSCISIVTVTSETTGVEALSLEIKTFS